MAPDTTTPRKGPWRPKPLRTLTLIVFCMICVLFIIALELIIRGCSSQGCYVFKTLLTTGVSNLDYFMYNSVPTILTASLSLYWSVVHHEVLRLEPYFQMSAPDGAAAADSIFLDYPYSLQLSIPLRAFKRKHYVVLLSVFISVVINFFFVPLGSGIFDDTYLERFFMENSTRAVITPGYLSAKFSFAAYDYAWLYGPMLPFTTPEYALLPIRNATDMFDTEETWSAETTLFEAGWNCEYATARIISQGPMEYFRLEVTTENNTSDIINGLTAFATPWSNIAQVVSNDTNAGTQTWVVVWASGPTTDISVPRNMTARRCTASYFSQTVIANFTMPSGKVNYVNRTGIRQPFTDTSLFGRAIDWDPAVISVPQKNRDSTGQPVGLGYTPPTFPEADPQLIPRFGRRPLEADTALDNLTLAGGYSPSYSSVSMRNNRGLRSLALYNTTTGTLSQLLDPEELDKAYGSALRLLFAMAVSMEMIDTNAKVPVSVTRNLKIRGFKVFFGWARGAQACLYLVVTFLVIFIGLNRRRQLNLDGEPNSLGAALRLLEASPELAADMVNAEFLKADKLRDNLAKKGRRYKLRLDPVSRGPSVGADGESYGKEKPPGATESSELRKDSLLAMKRVVGVPILLCLVAILALLVTAYVYSTVNNGLVTINPSNRNIYRFLFTYAPVSVSMALSPTLIHLATCHSMVSPYKWLIKISTDTTTPEPATPKVPIKSRKSILVDYDMSPAQFQLVRAIRGRHKSFTALIIAIILTRPLAVAFASLFTIASYEYQFNREALTVVVPPQIRSPFRNTTIGEYYILQGRFSGGKLPPNWATSRYYVLPFKPTVLDGLLEYEGPTLGVGVDIGCSLVPTRSIDVTECANAYGVDRQGTNCTGVIRVDDICWPHIIPPPYNVGDVDGLDYRWSGISSDSFVRSARCPDTFFATWVERPANPTPDPQDNTTLYDSQFNALILKCTATEKISWINTTVDQTGRILSTVETGQLDAQELEDLYSPLMEPRDRLIPTFLDSINNGTYLVDKGSTHQMMWLDYLMATIDPSIVRNITNVTHIPDTRHVVPALENILRRLFAIKLELVADDILSLGEPELAVTRATGQRNRVTVNFVLFVMSAVILLYTIVVLVGLYFFDNVEVPRVLPDSLAGMYAHLYASNLKSECGRFSVKYQEMRMQLKELGGHYYYGEFNCEGKCVPGECGVWLGKKKHFGVFRQPGTGSTGSVPYGEERAYEKGKSGAVNEEISEVREKDLGKEIS